MDHAKLIYLLCVVLVLFGMFLDASRTAFDMAQLKDADRTTLWMAVKARAAEFASTFCYALAISLFIAVAFVGRLEQVQARKHKEALEELQKAVNVDVFDSLFKSLMPTALYDVIKEKIIKSMIVRKNADWRYEFEALGDGRVLLTQTFQYQLENIGRTDVHHPVGVKLIQQEGESLASIKAISCRLDGEALVNYFPDSGNDSGNLKIDSTGNTTAVRALVKIPPKKHVDYTMILETEYQGRVSDAYFTRYPIINANLHVTFPRGYRFKLFQCMSSELQPVLDPGQGATRRIYRLEGAVLPDQGFMFELSREAKSTNADLAEVS